MKKVFVARPIPEHVRSYLAEHVACVEWEGPGKINREQFFELLADADGLLTSGTPIDAKLISHAPKLKVVSNMSVGYNNFDLKAMSQAGIIGTHTPGVLDDTVADLIFSLILSTARRIAELDQLIRKGDWVKGMSDESLFGIDVHHKTLGIIGMGRIGQAVAKRAHLGFDMDVLYYNRTRNEQAERAFGAEHCSLADLLTRSDFVVIMTPLTKETEKMIGREQFALMRHSAIFINASRGQTVDEAALIEALRSKTIRGAGLDVFEVEPLPTNSPLIDLPNVVLAPHIGSATVQTRDDMAMLAAQNIVAVLTGGTPLHPVKELAP